MAGLEEPLDVRGVDFLGDSARGELGQQGVHAAHQLGSLVTDVGVRFGQQAQHLAVPDRGHLAQRAETQGGDGDRQRVVGVVLVRPSRRQNPDSRRQGGRHIHHGLTGGDQLLGEQIAPPGGGLDRPPAPPQRFGPRHQLVHLAHPGSDLLANHLILAAIDRHRCVTRLVRVDTSDHCHSLPPWSCLGEPRRALLLRVDRACSLSSHTTARPSRDALRSKARPATNAGRQALRERPRKDL